MAQIVKMPDGAQVSFPDDMPKEEIRALIEEKFPDAAKSAAAAAPAPGDPKMPAELRAKIQEIVDADPWPIASSIVKGLDAGGGLSPEEEASGEWSRGVIAPIATKKGGEQKLVVPGFVMGAYDAFKLPGDVMQGKVDPMSDEGIARGVGFTTVFSPGAPKVGPKTLPGNTLAMVPKSAGKSAIPSASEIKTVAQAAYKQAEGSQIAPTATPSIVGALRSVLDKEGLIRPDGKLASTFKQVRTAMKDAEAYDGKPMTFEQFQRLEEALQAVAGSKVKGEARIGEMLLDELDKSFANLADDAFSKGSGAAAKAGYAGGKEGWALYSKLRRIEKAVSDAELAKGGLTEGLRSKFRTILKSERESRGFSKDELLMMRQFVMGGKVEKITEWMTGLRGMLAGGVGGGVLGAMALPVAGAALKKLGGGNATKTANQLRASIASGAKAAPEAAATSQANTLSPAALSANGYVRAVGTGGADRVASQADRQSLRLRAGAM